MNNNRYICKAKRKDNGKWVEGYYVCLNENCHRIYTGYAEKDGDDYYPEYCEVIPETIRRCTGLKDKNGKLIFEGDILRGFSYPFMSDGEYDYYALVVWSKDYCAFRIRTVKNPQSKVRGISDGNTEFMDDWDSDDWEVIGNDYDNPELLEVEK